MYPSGGGGGANRGGLPRGGGGGGWTARDKPGGPNPRSKEDRPWKHIEKILVDVNLFPPHLKPAAIIIGVKGCNHSRMQEESGCCVQLRGIGISSPGTPGSDEPMHLWIKYDSPEQLMKVREVFEDIILSCQRAHNYDPSKRTVDAPAARAPPAPVNLSNLPNTLPPKPSKAPQSPLECFFTIHYLAHAIPGILTEDFAAQYQNLFGYQLDPRLTQLGGSLTASLAMLPQIVSVRPLNNQTAHHVVEPVLPIGIPWQFFYAHVNRTAATQQPPPPPPPVAAAAAPPTGPSPPCLIIQALHALLFAHATKDVEETRGPYAERLRNWPGRPLLEIKNEFQVTTGIAVQGAPFGFASFEEFIYRTSSPEILELRQHGPEGLFIKLGSDPIDPDFSNVDKALQN